MVHRGSLAFHKFNVINMSDQQHNSVTTDGWTIIRYTRDREAEWNRFVAESRNGTFLLDRRFMDYHADRFQDCSLLAIKKGAVRAILPANLTEDGVLHSHQGLTYGGWLIPERHFDGADMMSLFDEWLKWCRSEGIREIDYKPIPYIYWKFPAADDLYALWRFGAVQTGAGLSSAFPLADRPRFEERQRRNMKRALREGITVSRTEDALSFMALVNSCLQERHGVDAVHSGEELARLRASFPSEIELWVAKNPNGQAEAGICVFNTGRVIHTQYISTTPEGRAHGSLALLFDHIMDVYRDAQWFDFGISTEDNGHYLNAGLLTQKSELGGRGLLYPRFTLTL